MTPTQKAVFAAAASLLRSLASRRRPKPYTPLISRWGSSLNSVLYVNGAYARIGDFTTFVSGVITATGYGLFVGVGRQYTKGGGNLRIQASHHQTHAGV